VCAFCADKQAVIDYKAVGRLRRYLSERARAESAKKTGTCAKHQRQLRAAIKRARFIGLLPYAPDHRRVTGPVAPPPPPREERPADDTETAARPPEAAAGTPEATATAVAQEGPVAAEEDAEAKAEATPEPEAEETTADEPAAAEEDAEAEAEATPEPEAEEATGDEPVATEEDTEAEAEATPEPEPEAEKPPPDGAETTEDEEQPGS